MKNGKRITALLLSLILCVYLLPNSAFADTVSEGESRSFAVIEEEESSSASELCEEESCIVSETPKEETVSSPEECEEDACTVTEAPEEETVPEAEVPEEETVSESEAAGEAGAGTEVPKDESVSAPEEQSEAVSETEAAGEEAVPEAEPAEEAVPAPEVPEEQDESTDIAFAPGITEATDAMYAAEDGMTEFNIADGTDWSYYSLYNAKNGKAVDGDKAFLIPEDGVTLLMFFSTTCGNCMADASSIADTEWISDERVRVMMLETNYSDQEETEAFLDEYTGTSKRYINAYYGYNCSSLMWDYAGQLFDTGTLYWPLLVLIVEKNGVPTIRYASTGYQYIWEITEHVEELLKEVKTPDAPVLDSPSASVRGISLSWSEVSDAVKYRVFRKEAGGSWEALKTTAKTTFTDASAKMGTKYAYKVLSCSGTLWSGDSNKQSILFNPFTDAASGGAAFKYISWAFNNGVVTGTSDTTFSPGATCTKIQFVMMLWKLHGSPVVDGTNPFSDISGTKTTNAILWALSKDIINSGKTFNPGSPITRSQIVMILWKLAGSPKASGTNPFSDIDDGTKLCKAVIWAYNSGITTGTSDTSFSPDKNCTRQQLVTFLFKYNNIYGLV